PSIATAPDLLSDFAMVLHSRGVVGEDRFAKVVYLALTSRVLARPVSVVAKGPSSAGKSFVVQEVVEFFPAAAYYALSSMSEHALAYSTEPLSHRFLILYEAAGLESEFASYLLRSLLSEGCIRYETVEKKKGEGMVPRLIVRDGPTGVILTTTAVSLHPENETRLLSVPANDTPQQTAAIIRMLACEDGRADDDDLGQWRARQAWIAAQDNAVTIPFSMQLAELVPPVAVRLRRDFQTVLNLVRAHAVLHQQTRERDGAGRIVATIGDYGVIRELVAELVAVGAREVLHREVGQLAHVKAVAGNERGQVQQLVARLVVGEQGPVHEEHVGRVAAGEADLQLVPVGVPVARGHLNRDVRVRRHESVHDLLLVPELGGVAPHGEVDRGRRAGVRPACGCGRRGSRRSDRRRGRPAGRRRRLARRRRARGRGCSARGWCGAAARCDEKARDGRRDQEPRATRSPHRARHHSSFAHDIQSGAVPPSHPGSHSASAAISSSVMRQASSSVSRA
ncbi:MAG: hypothetical protein WCH74_12760, partial [Chloroflexota bacterium]